VESRHVTIKAPNRQVAQFKVRGNAWLVMNKFSEKAKQQMEEGKQNAALVEESAAAAESLKHQAAKLAEVVGVFKISN
ncbi:MAG: hypothetical protein V4532_19410, partial [Pseudomonadota bacterium]